MSQSAPSATSAPSNADIRHALETLRAVSEQEGWMTSDERRATETTITTLDSLLHFP